METTLYNKQGSSDKVYQTQIKESGTGYIVTFQYGRRGSTLTEGQKTASPVSLSEAQKVYLKTITSKKSTGYTEGETGTPYLGSGKEVTGINCQLLNPLPDSQLEEYLISGRWAGQEKYDGKRMLLKVENGKVTATNRRGLECGLPENTAQNMLQNKSGTIIDGESIGDVFYAFDCLEVEGRDIRNLTYLQRYTSLTLTVFGDNLKLAPLSLGRASKRDLYNSLKEKNKEGIVFKDVDAPYTAGRPNSGGTQFKYKFQEEATCEVIAVNQNRRSVAVGVRDAEGKLVNVGNVAIPVNKEVPACGDFCEIRYLYFFKGGSLYQPFYKGLRDDKVIADFYDTLKVKPE